MCMYKYYMIIDKQQFYIVCIAMGETYTLKEISFSGMQFLKTSMQQSDSTPEQKLSEKTAKNMNNILWQHVRYVAGCLSLNEM